MRRRSFMSYAMLLAPGNKEMRSLKLEGTGGMTMGAVALDLLRLAI